MSSTVPSVAPSRVSVNPQIPTSHINGRPGHAVAEQGLGCYTPHIFRNSLHARAWIQAKSMRHMVAEAYARGRKLEGVDHRDEYDEDVFNAEQALIAKSKAQAQREVTQ